MNQNRFEEYEARVEAEALRALTEAMEAPEPVECPRCDGFGNEPGTDEPCVACEGCGAV